MFNLTIVKRIEHLKQQNLHLNSRTVEEKNEHHSVFKKKRCKPPRWREDGQGQGREDRRSNSEKLSSFLGEAK